MTETLEKARGSVQYIHRHVILLRSGIAMADNSSSRCCTECICRPDLKAFRCAIFSTLCAVLFAILSKY
ncbi:hypothetical protein PSP6_160084 [Paraburkholderia tropica]|nr:hypothetical protein PSP6_160084 [Paraburkholderia tropica]